MTFSKLFDFSNDDQILVVRDFHDDELEPYSITFTTEIDGVRASVKAGYKSEKECDKYFNAVDKEKAFKMYSNIRKSFSL
jgi:hypothetical protein